MRGAPAIVGALALVKHFRLRPALTMAFVLEALLVSGCAEPQAASAPSETAPAREDQSLLASNEGAIEGVVVDTSILPLPNVKIQLEESSANGKTLANTTSDDAGAFAFRHLAPNVYRLRAILEGYGEASTLATVNAAETAQARIVLDSVASTDPYVSLVIRTGLYRCAMAIIIRPENCDDALHYAGLGAESPYLQYYRVDAGHQAIVIETDWASKGTTMDMWASHANNESQWRYFTEVMGTPVIRMELRPGQRIGGLYDDPDGEFYGPVPESDVAFTLATETSYIGQFQRETNSTLYPVCRHTWGYCTGVGVVFDFRFQQYVTVFYHAAPDDLSRYSAVPDK